MGLIYHIAFRADWEQAQRCGEYRMSTRGKSLDEEGFIHAGKAHQVAPVANSIYRADRGLLVLVIDEDRIGPEIKYEQVSGWSESFPHIYGPLDIDAVVTTLPLDPGADGKFSFAFDHPGRGGC